MKDLASQPLIPIFALGQDTPCGPVKGRSGELKSIPITSLGIDDAYQRSMSQGSIRNIRKICADFDWAKFLPVIVVPDGDMFAIIDGQHRTTAAATIGIEVVPCYVLACSRAEAAGAFAAINGNVTPVSPQDVWLAELAAGDAKALEINSALEAASVRVVRKKHGYRTGETQSINVLRRAYEKYGRDLLITALQCITETGGGNPGLLLGAVVNGVALSIRAKSHLLAEPSRLFDVFDQVDLAYELAQAKIEAARTGNIVQAILTRRLNEQIRRLS